MLPVDEVLDELATTLADHNRAVLIAPPGAGKTTRVAPFLLSAGWLSNKKILLLEPRRLAARAAAHRMAEEMGQSPGEVTGYRIRLETKISARTRIEVLTEGILTRMFQNDPELPAAGMIIFDEFHERSMHADLGLALALEVQQTLRPDLRILCMSATLDASRLSSVLNAPVIRSEGKLFSVSVRYAGFSRDPVHVSASRAVRQAMQSEGDILVFLPGAGEIHRTAELVEADLGSARVLPLYGDLSDREQKSALEPDPGGRRKVILSTNIAETSLTIEGVRTVIDSGLERRLRFDPASGLSALELSRISRASADQRAGRAGRTAPGQCIRLYDEEEYRRMKPAIIPEILESDPSGLILEMAKWGSDESSLAFLDSPPRANLDQARALLRDLGALDSENRITQVGEAFVGLPVHPRIARMLLQCPASMLDAACDLAAVFGERDVFRHEGADLGRRLDLLRQGTARHVLRVAEDLRRTARALRDRSLAAISFAPARGEEAGFLAMLAYPDRIGALRRGSSNRYLLTSGRGAVLDEKDPLCGSPFLVCALLDDRPGDARIRLAARTGEAALRAVYGDRIEIREESAVEQGRPVRRTIEALGALVLSSAVETLEDPDLLLGEIKRTTLADFWNSEMENIAVRAALARSLGFEFPDCSRETLCANAEEWLGPFLSGMKSLNEAKAIDARLALETWLGREKTRLLAELFPESISVPSGSKIRLEYSEKEVVLPVKLQELFGLTATPTVARGRLPVTLHLLSPAKRPIQITQDLSGFWQRTYPEVRKELRGRYPRHPWPEDPMTEPPARGVKKRPQ
jgi:ATP-dependent helicase HrpB